MSFLIFLKFLIGSIAFYLLFFRKKKTPPQAPSISKTPNERIRYALPSKKT